MGRRAMTTETTTSSLPTPRSWSLNCNESSPTDNTIFEFSSTSPPAPFLADSDVESSTLRNKKRLEVLKKIYIATDDDALPLSVVLKKINFVDQSYPIWNEPYRFDVKDENDDNWKYAVQKPYRILLPPYEPVILVEDVTRRGQFFPFLPYTFDYYFDEALSVVPMPKITEDAGSSVTSDFLTTMYDDNYVSFFTTIEKENSETSHDDYLQPGNDYATISSRPLDIRDKEMNNYFYDNDEGQPPYVIHDYTERNESTTLVLREFKSNTVESATNNLYEERYDFANYPHEAISVHVDQSRREEASSFSSDESLNRDAIPYFEELEITSPVYYDSAFYRAGSIERNSDGVYDDYHENYDISATTSE
ncbi:uncharacterized protein LOC109857418 [Pseudomyrmex gracilis]|uniref:uncharacterized protein LOC109857418 n=1 Tax=Pseudomyrmex gracilis TaxID=219809 RepID=UPI0009957B27|nr:uncharacterized protein LOC109857418 [Pseudomyrmex gracilis]